ncbi:MAG: PLP-dependent aminotransferase family protein, partial [Acidobacteria bacterium]|nr:PLP-dependent aminotransferase family protein [Acidobacteriota bacterium]
NQHFEDRLKIVGENAGMHVMVRLQTELGDEEIVRRAAQVGVGLVSAQIYYMGESHSGEFVLGYAGLSERRIQEGVRRLAKALR